MVLEKIKNYLTNHGKLVVAAVSPIVLLCIIFALPIKTATVQVTEQYWDTEMKKQPYTVTESYTEEEPYKVTETRTTTIYDAYVYPASWSYTFTVDKPGTITVSIEGYTYPYPVYYYIRCPDSDGTDCRVWPYFYHDWYWGSGQAHAVIKMSYPEEVTKLRTVTKSREVTRYHEVPTPVLKEKTVTKEVKMSIWAYLFR
jgi:hypothetical protein